MKTTLETTLFKRLGAAGCVAALALSLFGCRRADLPPQSLPVSSVFSDGEASLSDERG